PVSLTDLPRSRSIPPASSKIASDARSGAIEKIGGLLICQPSADGTGMKSGSRCNLNRVFGSFPNQPASRGNFVFVAWRSWTNAPATAPGPALTYLYEHQTAKSMSQSCSASDTLPAAWARSKPITIPCFDGVGVRRQRRFFHQHLESRFCPLIVHRHHQVKIHRKAVHADHFMWHRTNQPRHRLAQNFVIRIPWRSSGVLRVNAKLCPV